MKKLLSIVVPVFNEEENVEAFHKTVSEVIEPLAAQYEFEFVFTDNHSTDSTFEKLKAIAERDGRVRAIRFSRNFGYQRSILTGYLRARGDAAIQLDCDLQDPPELIPEFLRKWEQGYHVVYGVRRMRKEGWFMHSLRRAFYRIVDYLSEDSLPHDAGDFRLVDRKVLDQIARISDAQPYLRGSIATIGFNQIGIPYDRAERTRGMTKFSWGDLFGLAMDGIVNHSVVPLRIATYTGLVVSLVTFLGLVVYVVAKFILGKDWPAGFATTTVLILLSLSLNALFLGIMGEYLGRIYKQVKTRPISIVQEEVNSSTGGENPED